MSPAVRALRGATTLDADTEEQVNARVQELVRAMLERNQVTEDELISVIFTATDDVSAAFPAAAARAAGLDQVPLLCARELSVKGGLELCIRVLMHVVTDRTREELHHVYLEGARALRDDLSH